MKGIQMVDLQAQLSHVRLEVDAAISKVLDEANFINGPEVNTFSIELAKWNSSEFAIPVANGTDGLQIAMMALGLKPGDEVIVPVFTYVATAEVIALLQLKPVFVDVDSKTFNIDVNQIERLVSNRTKAIVPVHLYGQVANMDEIMDFSKRHQLFVIEDCAQSIGAEYKGKKSGTFGHIGVTSFFPSKNLGCYGDGGAIFTNSKELAEKIKMISNHGQKIKYYHDVVGVNSRLDTLQAAILSVKLKHLHNYIRRRQEAAAFYDSNLNDIEDLTIPFRDLSSSHVFHQYTVKVANGKRQLLKEHLEKSKIPSMIYYPVPLHLQHAYSGLARKGDFPVSETLSDQVLSLPMHTELNVGQLSYICESIKEFFNG